MYGMYGYGYGYGLDPTIILVLIGVALSLWAQGRVNSTFSRYSRVRSMTGMTGAEAARRLLNAQGIYDVTVQQIAGELTDHYDPRTKTVNLSQSVYGATSVAAIGVAAHECGHAMQDNEGYAPLRFRSALVPVANFGSSLSWPLILLGLVFGGLGSPLVEIGILMFSLAVLFQLVTLPVEYNASARAVRLLDAQGILAGINAARFVQGKPSVILGRDTSYLGVLVDDLTTKGTNEPYRMMTSRCEYRLLLRQDNADLRLTEIGYNVGLASRERLERMQKKRQMTEETVARLKKTWLPKSEQLDDWLVRHGQQVATGSVCAADLLRRPGICYEDLADIDPRYEQLPFAISEQVNISLRYAGYIDKERRQVESFRQAENRLLPQNFDYMTLDGLRIEARQKLTAQQPRSIGEAGRISGVSPGDVTVLMVWLTKQEAMGKNVKDDGNVGALPQTPAGN